MTVKLYAFTCGTVTGEFAHLMEGAEGDITVLLSHLRLAGHAKPGEKRGQPKSSDGFGRLRTTSRSATTTRNPISIRLGGARGVPPGRLVGGGRRIRTAGPPRRNESVFAAEREVPQRRKKPSQKRGTEGSNLGPSRRESANHRSLSCSVGVDDGLLIDPAHLQGAEIKGILGVAIAGEFALEFLAKG
jgi:hypothetical protein